MANYNLNSQDKTYASIIQRKYQEWKTRQQPLFDEVEIYHQHYRAFINEDESYPWDYNLVDPVVFQLMRNVLARLNPDNMKVRLEATRAAMLAYTQKNQKLVNWEIAEMQKTLVFYRFLFRGLLAGRAYLSTGWRYEPSVEIKADGLNGQAERLVVMRDIVNRAEAKNVRFQDIFVPNENNPELMEQPEIIERVTMLVGDMYRDNETAKDDGRDPVWNEEYLKKIVTSKKFTRQVDYGVDLPEYDGDEIDARYKGAKDKKDMFARAQYFTMLRYQTLDGDEIYVPEDADCQWIMNTDTKNQYWHGHYPYLTWTPFPEDDDYFSMGIVQPVSDLQEALTSTLNQFLTNARKVGNPMWIVGKEGKNLPDWAFVNRPDGVIRFPGDISQVKQSEARDVTGSLLNSRRELKTTFETTSGISSLYMTGSGGQSSPQINKTATGARVIDANIDINLQLLISLFGAQALSQMGSHFLELNAQFITEEQEFKVTGEKSFEKIKPEEITANFSVVANADTITKINPITKQASYMNLLQVANAEKDVKINKIPLWKALPSTFPEMDNVDDIVIDPEEDAKEAIESIEAGVMPVVTYMQDHKNIIKLVQYYMLRNPDMEDTKLQMFVKYIDEQNAYIKASNPNLFMPQAPALPAGAPGAGGTPVATSAVPAPEAAAPVNTGLEIQGEMM